MPNLTQVKIIYMLQKLHIKALKFTNPNPNITEGKKYTKRRPNSKECVNLTEKLRRNKEHNIEQYINISSFIR